MMAVRGYCERLVDQLIPRLLAELPGLLLVGPRAVGKTTTAHRGRTARHCDASSAGAFTRR